MHTLSLTRPDDWHVHLRDGELLEHTVQATAMHFNRALVMPNLTPALTSLDSVCAYRNRITQHLTPGCNFIPYMTLYLNTQVTLDDILLAKKHDYILGAKYYPAGATTNSQAGEKNISTLYPYFEMMQDCGLVLQIHGETTSGDIFHREALFVEQVLIPLIKAFPKLKIILEHISTKVAVDFVLSAPEQVAATITPHHLLYNRNHLLAGGIRPHYYCLPILKRKYDQKALQMAAISGNPKFFAGTDSAPHAKSNKENACGCAGIYSAPYALAIYAQIFDELNALPQLNSFLSQYGAYFYELPISSEQIELIKRPQIIPDTLPLGQTKMVPIAAGQSLEWSVLS